jgi:hypothetical protein
MFRSDSRNGSIGGVYLEARKLIGSSVFLGLGGTFVPSDPIKKPTPIIGNMVTPASQNSFGAFVTSP